MTYVEQTSVAENTEQRVDMTFTGEIQACPHMAPRRQDPPRVPVGEQHIVTHVFIWISMFKAQSDLQRMQFVDRFVFMRPLQVQLNLPDQWETVGIGNVQFLHFTYTVFLEKHSYHFGNKFERH